VKGKLDGAFETNMGLDEIRKKAYDYKELILSQNRKLTVTALREKWFGEDQNNLTLPSVIRSSIVDLDKLVTRGIYKTSTLVKYKATEKHLPEYIKWRNNGCDILLSDLTYEFANSFQYYLQAEKGLSINSSGKMIKNLKKIIRDCVDKNLMERDPFWNYKVNHIDPKVPFLTTEELKALEGKEITIKRLDIIRDIFLFACYTGFAYIDVATLTDVHLKIGVDGKKWLIKPRQKTGISERVPLLPPALKILDKYAVLDTEEKGKTLLPIPSNQKVNAYLKELADICGITTKITFHIARHTFATAVTLQNGGPIDSVSKMLAIGVLKQHRFVRR
jgi:site-specific recombinase XerD